MKETREGEVNDGERNIEIRDQCFFSRQSYGLYVTKMKKSESGEPKPKFFEICKDLLFSKQINPQECF